MIGFVATFAVIHVFQLGPVVLEGEVPSGDEEIDARFDPICFGKFRADEPEEQVLRKIDACEPGPYDGIHFGRRSGDSTIYYTKRHHGE